MSTLWCCQLSYNLLSLSILLITHSPVSQVVHKWIPNAREPTLRSHVDRSILLVQVGDRFVPVAEPCVRDLGDEV